MGGDPFVEDGTTGTYYPAGRDTAASRMLAQWAISARCATSCASYLRLSATNSGSVRLCRSNVYPYGTPHRHSVGLAPRAKRSHLNPHFREPRKVTDLAEFAGDYIDAMRQHGDDSACADLVDYAASFFADVQVTQHQLEALGVMFVDRLYLYSSELTVKDYRTHLYFSKVTRYVLDVIRARGVRIFYILDNEIREDRFELALRLMFDAGMWVVTPYLTDRSPASLDAVRWMIDVQLLAGRHVAYIEKDASIDYLRPVKDHATATEWFVIFRNQVPTNRQLEHIPRRPSGGS